MGGLLTFLLIGGMVLFGSYSKIRKAFGEIASLPEVDPVGKPKVSMSSIEPEYFTYETVQDLDSSAELKRTTPNVVKKNVVEERESSEMSAVDFDLRQAVIYQTILQNPYCSETR